MLKGNKLTKAYGDNGVLKAVDIVVSPGEITAVIGPSGSGKSTLLRALSLLEPPDSGEIVIDDRVYRFPALNGALPPKPWPELTVVFQQLFLWPHLTLRQNIDLPSAGAVDTGRDSAVAELVEEFELGPLMKRFPNEVSLGQRQRAALVRAMALRPRYLLLDEITSALDVEHVSRVLDRLEKLQASGTGILLITHLIGFAQRSADHVVFIENGEILEAGGPSVLVSPTNERVRKFLSLVEGVK